MERKSGSIFKSESDARSEDRNPHLLPTLPFSPGPCAVPTTPGPNSQRSTDAKGLVLCENGTEGLVTRPPKVSADQTQG